MTKQEIIKDIANYKRMRVELQGKEWNGLNWRDEEIYNRMTKSDLAIVLSATAKCYENDLLKKEVDVQREAYLATPEGQAEYKRAEKLLEEAREIFKAKLLNLLLPLDNATKALLGNNWGPVENSICGNGIDITMLDTVGEPIFGSEIRFYYSTLFKKKPSLKMNIGTTGSFDVEGGDRAKFYIGVGKILSEDSHAKAFRDLVKSSIIECDGYTTAFDEQRSKLNKILKGE